MGERSIIREQRGVATVVGVAMLLMATVLLVGVFGMGMLSTSEELEEQNTTKDLTAEGGILDVENQTASGETGSESSDTTSTSEQHNEESEDSDTTDGRTNAHCPDGEAPEDITSVLGSMEGAGTEDAPYQITTVCELQAIAADRSGSYELTTDLAGSETDQWNDGAGFAPIGDESTPFTGSLDGNGHVVDGLTIDRSDEQAVGLFGATDGAQLSKLGLTDATVTGDQRVGALVGHSQDTELTRVSVAGQVTGTGTDVGGLVGNHTVTDSPSDGVITNVTVSGSVSGGKYVGGAVGYTDGLLRDAHSSATVDSSRGGGLVGWTRGGIVTQSSATGDVQGAGGLVGRVGHMGNQDPLPISGAVTQSYATGDVTGSNAGGLVGILQGGSQLTNSYAIGNVTSSGRAGGLVGTATQTSFVEHSYATGDVDGQTEVGGLVGFLQWSNLADSYWSVETTGQDGDVGGVDGSDQHHWLTLNTQDNGLTTADMTGAGAVQNMSLDDTEFVSCGAAGCEIIYDDNQDADQLWVATDGYPRLHWQADGLQPGSPATQSCEYDIIVDADENTVCPERTHATIQAGVDNAEAGETVFVKNGHYGSASVNKAITLLGESRDGVVIDESVSSTSRTGLHIGSSASPTISTLTIEGFERGISDHNGNGEWTASTVTLIGNEKGVFASNSAGNWTLEDSLIRDSKWSLAVWHSAGDWTVHNTTVIDNTGYTAINGFETSGAWTVNRSAFIDVSGYVAYADGADPAGTMNENWWDTTPPTAGSEYVYNVTVETYCTDEDCTSIAET